MQSSNAWLVLSFVSFSPQQPGIILLKEGTDSSQGKPQLISNISACQFIADAVRTTLGPRGMDKLIVDSGGVYILCIAVTHVTYSVQSKAQSLLPYQYAINSDTHSLFPRCDCLKYCSFAVSL